ncbi:hypothetical protein [Spirosoma lituiforme]
MKSFALVLTAILISSFSYAQSPNKKPVYAGTKTGGIREGNGVSAWSDVTPTNYIQFRKDSVVFAQDSLQRILKRRNGEKKNK